MRLNLSPLSIPAGGGLVVRGAGGAGEGLVVLGGGAGGAGGLGNPSRGGD